MLAAFAWGFGFYGQTVYVAEFGVRRGWPIDLVSAGTTWFYILTALYMSRMSAIVARLGIRRAVLLGVVVMMAALLALGQVDALWQLYAVYVALAYGWASMGVVMITTILGRWFEAKRALAISLAMNGASLGGLAVAPATIALADAYGFSVAMRVGAAAILLLLVPALVLYVRERDGALAEKTAAAPNNRELLRSAKFWWIAAPFALALVGQVGFIAHFVAFMKPMLGTGGASLALATIAVSGIAGRLVLGTVIHRFDPRRFAAATMASHIVVLVLLAFTTQPSLLYAYCAVFGFSLANLVILPSMVVQRAYPSGAFAPVVGLVTAVGVVTYAFGPGLVGYLRAATGSYTVPLLVCAGLYIAATVTILRKPGN